jgi:hypothetical protein
MLGQPRKGYLRLPRPHNGVTAPTTSRLVTIEPRPGFPRKFRTLEWRSGFRCSVQRANEDHLKGLEEPSQIDRVRPRARSLSLIHQG